MSRAADDKPALMPAAPADDPGDDGRQYIVLVADLLAREIDAYGPLSRTSARAYGARASLELQANGLEKVVVTVVALNEPGPAQPESAASSVSSDDGEPAL